VRLQRTEIEQLTQIAFVKTQASWQADLPNFLRVSSEEGAFAYYSKPDNDRSCVGVGYPECGQVSKVRECTAM
jgi:hypothetical protein